MKRYLTIFAALFSLASVMQTHANTILVFCSLTNNNGCSGMAMDKFNVNNINKPYFFATSHTEQGISTFDQLFIATNATNKACTVSKIDFGVNPCNNGHFGQNPYYSYERNWSTGDFIAGESDGSIVPYLSFTDGTNAEVKVYLAPHGSSEMNPKFYEPKNSDQRYYKICVKDFGTTVPTNGRIVQGYSVINGQKIEFTSKGQLMNSLTSYGFTTSTTDPNPSIITDNCP